MTKKHIREIVPVATHSDIQDLLFGEPIEKVIESLNDLRTLAGIKGWRNLSIDMDWNYDDYTLNLFGERLETDAEYSVRMKKEERREQAKAKRKATLERKKAEERAKDEAEYQRLKKKLGLI